MKNPVPYLVLALLLAPPARADDLQYLDHSELALARLYSDIGNATSTIDLTYLIWNPCSSAAKVLTKELAEKAHPKTPGVKPVKVRMVLDSFFQNGRLEAMQSYFARSGIDLKFYNGANPISNFHTHSKIALIDKDVPGKAHMVTGGRNIADEYFGMAAHNYVDRDVEVTAPSASEDGKGTIAQAKSGFDKLWANPRTFPVGAASDWQASKLASCTKWTARDAQLEKYLKQNAAKIIAGEKPVTCGEVSYTLDDMSHVNLPESRRAAAKPTSQAVLRLVAGAKRSLTMENQYFIPDDDYMKGLLGRKKNTGVKIDVYSNMFEKPIGIESVLDQDNFEIVSYWQREEMRAMNGNGETNHMNFRIAGMLDRWAFSPPVTGYSYHAKTFVADGKDALVSSFNIDPRSMKINGESALAVKNCPAFAQKVESTTKLTGKVWTLEENLQTCLTGFRPAPPIHDPITHLIEFFTKDLQ